MVFYVYNEGAHYGLFGSTARFVCVQYDVHLLEVRCRWPDGQMLRTCPDQAQIARWRVVIAIFGNECSTGRQLADMEEEAVQDVLSNIFADKAANTLSRRATSWTLFLKCHLREPGADFNGVLTEPLVYTYVETLRKQAAPATRAQSFSEAVGFAKGTICCNYDVDSVVSARVKGAAYSSWETKRVTI